jgi:hypothetical protein
MILGERDSLLAGLIAFPMEFQRIASGGLDAEASDARRIKRRTRRNFGKPAPA